MKKILFAFPYLFVFLALISCGGYNLNYLPPANDAEPNEIFPQNIDGMKPEYRKAPDIGGIIAVYGSGKITIRVSRLKTKEEADTGFKKAIVPQFKDFPVKSSGKINGIWKASGKDGNGRKYYAWVNQNYIFMITGADEKQLLKGIDAFQYISQK